MKQKRVSCMRDWLETHGRLYSSRDSIGSMYREGYLPDGMIKLYDQAHGGSILFKSSMLPVINFLFAIGCIASFIAAVGLIACGLEFLSPPLHSKGIAMKDLFVIIFIGIWGVVHLIYAIKVKTWLQNEISNAKKLMLQLWDVCEAWVFIEFFEEHSEATLKSLSIKDIEGIGEISILRSCLFKRVAELEGLDSPTNENSVSFKTKSNVLNTFGIGKDWSYYFQMVEANAQLMFRKLATLKQA